MGRLDQRVKVRLSSRGWGVGSGGFRKGEGTEGSRSRGSCERPITRLRRSCSGRGLADWTLAPLPGRRRRPAPCSLGTEDETQTGGRALRRYCTRDGRVRGKGKGLRWRGRNVQVVGAVVGRPLGWARRCLRPLPRRPGQENSSLRAGACP